MDATTTPLVRSLPAISDDPRFQARRIEHLVDALKEAVENTGEHRLFRWGKLDGLFPGRVGAAGSAATLAVQDGLLEITRTETRGKIIVEWVRATPQALAYLHDHDSPKAVLRELRGVLAATRGAVPHWMEQARDEATQLAVRFEHHSREMLERLDKLTERVDAALRRAEAAKPMLGSAMAELVPWGIAALEYLDRRTDTVGGDCPLPDLFRAMHARFADLTLPAYHDGLRRLHDARAIRLVAGQSMDEPEYAMVVEKQLVGFARR